ncbi:hypothetical protein [Streptomyces sampsonii]
MILQRLRDAQDDAALGEYAGRCPLGVFDPAGRCLALVEGPGT